MAVEDMNLGSVADARYPASDITFRISSVTAVSSVASAART